MTHFEEFLSIEMSNRYFTPRRGRAPGADEIPFSMDVDPHGLLAMASGKGFFHSADNEVLYFEKVLEERGEGYKYVLFVPPFLFSFYFPRPGTLLIRSN